MHASVKETMQLSPKVNDLQESSEQEKRKEYRDYEQSCLISALKAEIESLQPANQTYVEQLHSLSIHLYRHTEKKSRYISSFKRVSFLMKTYKDIAKEKVELEAQLKEQKHQLTVLEMSNYAREVLISISFPL